MNKNLNLIESRGSKMKFTIGVLVGGAVTSLWFLFFFVSPSPFFGVPACIGTIVCLGSFVLHVVSNWENWS